VEVTLDLSIPEADSAEETELRALLLRATPVSETFIETLLDLGGLMDQAVDLTVTKI
jgi:hypothetical protein